jgi:hypothetical protein
MGHVSGYGPAMISKRIANATHYLGAPKDWKPDEHGKCAHLAVRRSGSVYQSAWEPTPRELAILNAGGSVVLSIVGGQPPVALHVEPADEMALSDDGPIPDVR